jgi:hypothetical protein
MYFEGVSLILRKFVRGGSYCFGAIDEGGDKVIDEDLLHV